MRVSSLSLKKHKTKPSKKNFFVNPTKFYFQSSITHQIQKSHFNLFELHTENYPQGVKLFKDMISGFGFITEGVLVICS